MRKLLAVVFLFLVAGALWYGGRWFRSEHPLEATLIFDRRSPLRAGDAVTHDDVEIGRIESVTTVGRNRQAVVVRIDGVQRHLVRTDSTWALGPGGRSLAVGSRLAVGPPLADGAVVHARSSQIAEWIDKGAGAMVPIKKKFSESADELIRMYEAARLDEQFAEWKAKVPEWKKSGDEVFDRNLSDIQAQVEAAEQKLRAAKKNVDADRLRAQFDEWLASVRD